MAFFKISKDFSLKNLTKVNGNVQKPFEYRRSCTYPRALTFFGTRPICATHKRGENSFRPISNCNRSKTLNFFLFRNEEESTKSRFDQEHKRPKEKCSTSGLTKFRISAQHYKSIFPSDMYSGRALANRGLPNLRHFCRAC